MRSIEEQLLKAIRKVIDKEILVFTGPFDETKNTGVRPEVFIHAHSLLDMNGVMPDGAQVSKRPVSGPSTYRGFEEERPGRIELMLTCTTGNYKLLQEISSQLTVATLSELQMLPKIPLGQSKDKAVTIQFEDFTHQLHKAELNRIVSGDYDYFKGVLTFYLNGFIHLRLTRKGGFKSGSSSGQQIKTRKITTASVKRSLKKRKDS